MLPRRKPEFSPTYNLQHQHHISSLSSSLQTTVLPNGSKTSSSKLSDLIHSFVHLMLFFFFLLQINSMSSQHQGFSHAAQAFSSATLNCTFLPAVGSSSSAMSPYESSSLSPPPKGSCKGPLHRVQSSRLVAPKLNLGCPLHLLPYYKPGSIEIQCGECVPGTSGSGVSFNSLHYLQCKANEYCNDDAKCTPLTQHPLYMKPCPYEILLHSQQRSDLEGIPTFCGGSGLVCIEHVCRPCREGDIDYNTGVKCILGEWSYASWVDSTMEPSPLILFALSVMTLLYVLVVNLLCRGGLKLSSKVLQNYSREKRLKNVIKLTSEFIKTLESEDQQQKLEENDDGDNQVK
nr:unnamed protein product [Naegleria fowleri]